MATELKQKNIPCHAKVSSNVLWNNRPVSCKFNLCGSISEATSKANLQVLARMPERCILYIPKSNQSDGGGSTPRDEQGDKFVGMGRRMEKNIFASLVLLVVLCREGSTPWIAAVSSYARSMPPPPSARHKEKRDGNSRAEAALRRATAKGATGQGR